MNKQSRTVSIVLSTYNRENFVQAAVVSVLSQSFVDFEVIVVDDGSSDGTATLLNSIGDPRLRYEYQQNHGRSCARNVAIGMASGKYIAFLDSDDLYLAEKLRLQVDYLDTNPDVDMVHTSWTAIDEAGNSSDALYEVTTSATVNDDIAFFIPVPFALSTVMLRHEVFEKVGLFDEKMERFEDIDLWRRIAKHHNISAMREVTCQVRPRSDNTLQSQDPAKILTAIEYYVEKVTREDIDIDPLVRGAGARRFCEHHAATLLDIDPHTSYGERLLQRARQYFEPKVSIIIPVFNGENYLAQAIDSALAQTYTNTEVVVINDGSTDDGATERVARSFGERIRYFEKSNGGVATALNRGIKEMTGDYFSWLSHDDLYLPHKLEAQISKLAEVPDPLKCVIYGDFAVFTDDSEVTTPVALPHVNPENFRHFITTANIVHGCTLLIPRNAFEEHGGFDPRLRTTQDYDLWFKMASTLDFIHQPLISVKARSHAEQGSLAMSNLVLDECNALLGGFVEALTESEVLQSSEGLLAEGYFRLTRNLQDRGFLKAGERALALGRQTLSTSAGDNEPGDFIAHREETCVPAIQASDLERICKQRDAMEAELECHRHLLDEMRKSNSWRLTAPLRRISELMHRIVG